MTFAPAADVAPVVASATIVGRQGEWTELTRHWREAEAGFGLIRRGSMSETTDTVQAVTGRLPSGFFQFATEIAATFSAP